MLYAQNASGFCASYYLYAKPELALRPPRTGLTSAGACIL